MLGTIGLNLQIKKQAKLSMRNTKNLAVRMFFLILKNNNENQMNSLT